MNFRNAKKTDKNELYRLWESAFGDSENDIERFFESVISYENVTVCCDGKKIVSMLSLLPARIAFPDAESVNGFCVYAAATDKQYRKRGIMSALLDFSAELAKKRNADMLFLHPANEKLYSYYEKNGFKRAFYLGNEIHLSEIKDGFSYPYVAWNEQVLRLSEYFCEDKTFLCEYGYADYSQENGRIRVNTFLSSDIKSLLGRLSEETGCKDIFVRLPEADLSKAQPQGMIRCLNNKTYDNNIYLGITLE